MQGYNLLHKSITPAATSLVLLQLDKFEFAKRLKDVLEVTFSDAEMNVTHVQPVKWSSVIVAAAGLRIAGLAVLFRFSQLRDNGNS